MFFLVNLLAANAIPTNSRDECRELVRRSPMNLLNGCVASLGLSSVVSSKTPAKVTFPELELSLDSKNVDTNMKRFRNWKRIQNSHDAESVSDGKNEKNANFWSTWNPTDAEFDGTFIKTIIG